MTIERAAPEGWLQQTTSLERVTPTGVVNETVAAAPAGSSITTATLPAGLGAMGSGQTRAIQPAGLSYMG